MPEPSSSDRDDAEVASGEDGAASAEPDSASPPAANHSPQTEAVQTEAVQTETTADLPRTVGATPMDEPGSRPRPAQRRSRHEPETEQNRSSRWTSGARKVRAGADLVRSRVASLVWLIAVLAASALALGALLVALKANQDNALVSWVLDLAHRIDGPFWRVFEFCQDKRGARCVQHDAVKEHLVNWGLAAVAYLIAGRILDRVIRP